MKVVAQYRGYFGSIIREPGDAFDIPDDLAADPARRPKWVLPEGGRPWPSAGPTDKADGADAKNKADKPAKGKANKAKADEAETPIQQEEPVKAPDGSAASELGGGDPDWVPQAVAD